MVSISPNGRPAIVYMGGSTNENGETWMQSHSWVNTVVNGRSGGLDLGSKTSWRWESDDPRHACMTLTFAADPTEDTVKAGGVYWAFRWKGNHETDVHKRLASGQFVIDKSGLSEKYRNVVGVFHDDATDYTYAGCRVKP